MLPNSFGGKTDPAKRGSDRATRSVKPTQNRKVYTDGDTCVKLFAPSTPVLAKSASAKPVTLLPNVTVAVSVIWAPHQMKGEFHCTS